MKRNEGQGRYRHNGDQKQQEMFLTSSHIIRHLLLATTLAWGVSAATGWAMLGDTPLPVLIGELQGMTPDQRAETFRRICEEMANAPPLERQEKQLWLKAQWAALSPDQRGQLRNQIRDHWQHMAPEQRQHLREERRGDDQHDSASEGQTWQDDSRQQRLSPDQRQEFHQWMRGRRDSNEEAGGGQGWHR